MLLHHLQRLVQDSLSRQPRVDDLDYPLRYRELSS